MMAASLDDAHFVAYNRELKAYTGTLLGEKVSMSFHRYGLPFTAIAVEELIKVGCDTFIRVGTSGAMQPGIKTGDVAIVTAAIRDEGTTLHYLPPEFPAIADVDVVTSLAEGARKLGITSHSGISQTKNSFYRGDRARQNACSQPVAGALGQPGVQAVPFALKWKRQQFCPCQYSSKTGRRCHVVICCARGHPKNGRRSAKRTTGGADRECHRSGY